MQTYEKFQNNFDSVSVRILDKAVTKKDFIKALNGLQEQKWSHIPEFVAYHMTEHVQVGEESLRRTINVTLYGVYGKMQQVTPSELVAGNYVTFEDYAGCLIDADSAYKLFGSNQVTGQQIVIHNKVYSIRGVIESEMPIVMIQEKSETTEFWNLELNYGSLLQGGVYARQFMMNFGLSKNFVLIEGNFIADCMGNLLVLPMLVLTVIICFQQWRQIGVKLRLENNRIKEKHYRTRKDLFTYLWQILLHTWKPILLSGGMIVICIVVWNSFGFLPIRYVPSKWSDFSQYTRVFRELYTHQRELSYITPTRREVLLEQYSMVSLLLSVTEVLLVWHLTDLFSIRNKVE